MAFKTEKYKGQTQLVIADSEAILNSEQYNKLFSFGEKKLGQLIPELDNVIKTAMSLGIAVPEKYRIAATEITLVKAS